jgi:hypothetical protein
LIPPTHRNSYDDIRPHLRVGDMLAFVGRAGLFSWAIRTFTGTPTHIAPIAWIDDPGGEHRVVLVEAIEGQGVVKSYASDRISAYKGEVYVMRLDPMVAFDMGAASRFLVSAIGQPYSMIDALLSAPSQWFRIPGRDRAKALFCSKLAWRTLVQGRVNPAYLGRDRSPTPNQFMKLPIWCQFIQVAGEARPLR